MSVDTQSPVEPHDHVVQFYECDEELVQTVSTYLGEGIRADEVAIVVATTAHTVAFEEALRRSGIDTTAASESGALVTLDAGQALSRFMAGDGPDADAFDEVMGGLVRRAAQSGRRIRAYGEMVALLWDAGQVAAAIELESLWNRLGLQLPFSLFCAYPTQSVAGEDHAAAVQQICHLHSAIVGDSSSRAKSDPATLEKACSFEKGPHAPRAARQFVVESLLQWGYEEPLDDAALVVSELAANAVLHAQSDFTVALSSLGDRVRIAVSDASSDGPVLHDSLPSTAPSGRGVALVAALAQDWGCDVNGADGKVVWAEFRR
jgi:hypothetical protein